MSAKDILLEVAEKLPPDATLADAIYELEFRQAVEDGLASLDRGQRVPLEEAANASRNGFQSIPLRRCLERFGADCRLHRTAQPGCR